MMLTNWPERDRGAVAAFYAEGDAWTWAQMEAGTSGAARAATEWLLQSPAPPNNAVVLPRVVTRDRKRALFWYAAAFSERQFEELREQLNSFLGPAGTDFDGMRADLDPTDPAEGVLANWTGGRVFRLRVLGDARNVVREALLHLQETWKLRPALRSTQLRTTEALLGEFFAALTNQDDAAARHWLDELQVSGRLSAENLTFLQIERLAAFGRWAEIVVLPQFSQLLYITRPRHISALLIEALWHTELAGFMISNDARGVLQHFRTHVFPRHVMLFRARGDLATGPVVLAFLLAAVAADPPRRDQIQTLLALLPPGVPTEFGRAIASLVPPSEAPIVDRISPLDAAREAFQADDYDTAWRHLQKAEASVDVCRLMVECAVEIGTTEAAQMVEALIADLSEEDREAVFTSHRRRRAWQELQNLAPGGTSSPTDWEGWFDRLYSDPTWPRIVEVAHEATSTWPVAPYQLAPSRVEDLAERLLEERPPQGDRILRLALPHLVAFFLREGEGESVFIPFYRRALLLIGLSDSFGGSDWGTAQTLLLSVLECGPDATDYAEAVTVQKELWEAFGAVHKLDWALDTLDLLVSYPAPSPAERDSFFETVRNTFASFCRRVRPEHWKAFRYLCEDLERIEAFDALRTPISEHEEVPESELPNLEGRLIGIYTLTESVGARAKTVIEEMFPGVKVRVNHDTVGSERLKTLARETDYLIVSTRSATHAATDFLKAHRPKEATELIYPSGKGFSSIVTALRNELGCSNA